MLVLIIAVLFSEGRLENRSEVENNIYHQFEIVHTLGTGIVNILLFELLRAPVLQKDTFSLSC